MRNTVAWLEPYLQVAWNMGVPIENLKQIIGYRLPKGKYGISFGSTVRKGRKNHTIRILDLYEHDPNVKRMNRVASFEMSLNVLAHELTHLKHWNHSPERFIFEGELLLAFAKLAKKLGYRGYD